ncbi:hypothetical protein [Fischerella sp.]|nr:hypothetical protein [Fischerella sp.]
MHKLFYLLAIAVSLVLCLLVNIMVKPFGLYNITQSNLAMVLSL